ERVAGALFVPHDGSAAATVLTHALIAQAQAHGVRFEAHCAVRNIEVVSNQVRALETTHDRIAAEVVIIAAGIWSRQLARLAGVALPVVPLQHQYVVTD